MRNSKKTINPLLFCFSLSFVFFACEPEVGMVCSSDSKIQDIFSISDEFVLQDSAYDCDSTYCMKKEDDSRPYCTKRCETKLDCTADGFSCLESNQFGSLGCPDFESTNNCLDSTIRYKYCTADEGTLIKRDK